MSKSRSTSLPALAGWIAGIALLLVGCAGGPTVRSGRAVRQLQVWLSQPRESRSNLTNEAFATVPLTKADANRAADLLWADRLEWLRQTRRAEFDAKVIEAAGKKMRFEVVRFGGEKPPEGGRSLFISMHGGGGAPPQLNESQWRNQVRLATGYAPAEGIYIAPRAPTDTWNLWHEAHIDPLFARLIEDCIALEGVNPDRVYLMGYSAGGDGVYQLAPRMADWWAAAAMSAGHPNETVPFGLRNVPFVLMVGERDALYRRNEVAAEWGGKLKALREADPGGYEHFVKIPAGKPHWMGLEDKAGIPWMEARNRNPLPTRIAWRQDDVIHPRFYWLAVDPADAKQGQQVVATREGQEFKIVSSEAPRLRILLNDDLADLDRPVRVRVGEATKPAYDGVVTRTLGTLWKTLEERGDRRLTFSAEVSIAVP